jgi:four helix bundle protein
VRPTRGSNPVAGGRVKSKNMINPKHQILNSKQIQSTNDKISKRYDLEERTLKFAKEVIVFVKGLPRTVANAEIAKQLIRSSSSIGANYIEANESLSKKDFLMRSKICRKESKETAYWLKLVETKNQGNERETLIREATELMKIFGSIVEKTK